MRRRNLSFLAIVLLLLFVLACGVSIVAIGIIGWRWSGQEDGSRSIRIIPLPSLSTATTSDSQPGDAGGQIPSEGEEAAPVAPTESATSEAGAAPPVFEQSQAAPELALPPGSVNSITQEGVGTRLVIPKLNLDAPIILSPLEGESWKVDHLGTDYVGHLEGTAPPGSSSNIVLAAHVTVSAGVYGPFANLAGLSTGDEVYVYEGEQAFKYIIDDYQIVDRTAIDVTYPSEQGQITLITCTNWSSQEGRYIERVVLKGYLAGG
jgi:LPXTG-site transpeptidase (sortase) family protein